MHAGARGAESSLHQPRDLVHIPTRNVQSGVVTPDSIGIGRLEKAVHRSLGVVEQLDLPDLELVFLGVLGDLGDLLNGFAGNFRSSWKSMNLGTGYFPCLRARRKCSPGESWHRRRYASLSRSGSVFELAEERF